MEWRPCDGKILAHELILPTGVSTVVLIRGVGAVALSVTHIEPWDTVVTVTLVCAILTAEI